MTANFFEHYQVNTYCIRYYTFYSVEQKEHNILKTNLKFMNAEKKHPKMQQLA